MITARERPGSRVLKLSFTAAAVILVASTSTVYWIGQIALESNRALAEERELIERAWAGSGGAR